MTQHDPRPASTLLSLARGFAAAAAVLVLPAPALALELEVRSVDDQVAEGSVQQTYQRQEVALHDQVAAAKITYQIRNDSPQQLEISCALALGPNELVDGFSYWNGDEKIVGEVLEKEVATQVYEEITGLKRDPGLLEQEGSRFRFRVFPVLPGENKPVEVRTLTALEIRRGVVEYTISRDNLPAAGTLFSLQVDITDDLPIHDVETLGFAGVVTRFGPHHQRVVYEAQGAAFTEDLRIRYRLAVVDHALRFVAHRSGDTEGSFMLLVSPKDVIEEREVLGRDLVFVVDVSGSMEGEPLARTKDALAAILVQLRAGDRFDVIAFSDEPVPVFGQLRPVEDTTRRDALRAVKGLNTAGGTNIRGALAAALDELQGRAAGRPRAVIFLTDGQGNDPPETVLAAVDRHPSAAAVFSVGIGHNVHRSFLERLATHHRGTATFIQSAAQIEPEMAALYERIAMPLMTDLELRFDGVTVQSVYPRWLPDLHRDGQVVVFGRYRTPGSGRVVVTGTVGDAETRELALDVVLPEAEERHAYVEKLWAARRVAGLLDRLGLDGESEELVQEVTRLGIVYNLLTPYTTFLAVPESLQTAEVKERIRQGTRGYDRKLVDSMEGIRLSMAALPPGDPVLTLAAPADARKVVAYFPFGLVKRLSWDAQRGHWSVRFLVPRDVPDGIYVIRVAITHRDGRIEWKEVEYIIDGTAPEFVASVPSSARPGELLPLEVDPFEPVRQVTAWLPGVSEQRVKLTLDPATGHYTGALPLPPDLPEGVVSVRIVVRDRARNRFDADYEVRVVAAAEPEAAWPCPGLLR